MSAILYYITGHGYGHAVRSAQVICGLRRARPNLRIHVRTTAPAWLFPDSIYHHKLSIDIGIRQNDSLDMNLSETLNAWQALQGNLPSLLDQEIAFVQDQHIQLIIGDIPPYCFEIAARAAIPSAAITNFTWDFIYRAYLRDYPNFLPLIRAMEVSYGRASLALTLPYPCDMAVFPRREPIPWVARISALTKKQARAKFGLPQDATVILLSFGGFGLERMPWNKLERLSEFLFVGTSWSRVTARNLLVYAEAQRNYEDLIRAVDVIVTKPGYGIVADAIAHQVPMLYTDRGEFPEYPRLEAALIDNATALHIPQAELLSGDIAPRLGQLLDQRANWPAVPLNGAEIAAQKLVTLMDGESSI